MYSNHGTSHRGSTPYLSLKVADYAVPERANSLNGQSTPPLTPTSFSRDFPHSKQPLAVIGGPLSSHPVTPIDTPEAYVFTVPAPPSRRPSQAASTNLDAMTDSTTSQFDALSTQDQPMPDLSLRMPGSSAHQHSQSVPLNQMYQFEHPTRRRSSTLASRFLRLRSLSSLRSAASSIRGNDSRVSLQPTQAQSTTTLIPGNSRHEQSNTRAHRPATATDSPSLAQQPPARTTAPPSRGTKRPASPSSPGSHSQTTSRGDPASPSTSAGHATLSRRARKKSMELLSSARRVSGLYLWGAPGDAKSAQQGEREDAGKENEGWRLPEMPLVDTRLGLEFR